MIGINSSSACCSTRTSATSGGSRDAAALYSQAIEQLVRFGMEAPALAGQLATEHADQIVRQIQSYIARDTTSRISLAS